LKPFIIIVYIFLNDNFKIKKSQKFEFQIYFGRENFGHKKYVQFFFGHFRFKNEISKIHKKPVLQENALKSEK
jgi:hypothetical protein